MAVIETGAIFKSLRFDGIDSRDFGVYITGEAVYNAPERDVEMITIPGRNGDYALDKGRFKNITVTYPAGLMQGSAEDFKQALSDFRNALCSRVGYKRLEDDYHADEFRMAVYKSGLDVTPADLQAGEFSITFECKPQRFLTSGESAIGVLSSDVPRTLTNPTLFPAKPLILFTEYNTATLTAEDGSSVTVDVANVPVGDVTLAGAQTVSPGRNTAATITVPNAARWGVNPDPVRIGNISITYTFGAGMTSISSVTADNPTGPASITAGERSITATFNAGYASNFFVFGTAKTVTETFTANINNGQWSIPITLSIAWDGVDTFTLSRTWWDMGDYYPLGSEWPDWSVGEIVVTSSIYGGGAVFVDCETGEAWMDEDGEITSANSLVTFSTPNLPELKPGETIASVARTTTAGVRIKPRWWKV